MQARDDLDSAGPATMTRAPCHSWPYGTCRYGDECIHEHHPNLDPALHDPDTRAHPDCDVLNDTGVACMRCLESGRYCDKSKRSMNEDDPCSECRHFGGENCKCRMLKDTSYNDAFWRKMISRRAQGYTLSDYKERVHNPMADRNVMPGWKGASKEELLEQGDMLPAGVRQCPRAYLVPPRDSRGQQKSKAHHAAQEKRTRASDDEDVSSASTPTPMAFRGSVPTALPVFPPPLPPVDADPTHGEVIWQKWDTKNRQWVYEYENGAEFKSQRMGNPFQQPPERPTKKPRRQ